MHVDIERKRERTLIMRSFVDALSDLRVLSHELARRDVGM